MRQIIGAGAELYVDADTGDFRLCARAGDRPPYHVPHEMKRAVALSASRVAFSVARAEGDARAQYLDTARDPKLQSINATMSREGSARAHAERITETLEAIVGPLYTLNETQTGRTRPITLTDTERRELETLTWGEW